MNLASITGIIGAITKAVEVAGQGLELGKDVAPIAKKLFDTFVKKSEPGVPGTNGADESLANSALDSISHAFEIGNALLAAGKDVTPVAEMLYKTFVLRENMTQDELDEFVVETDRLSDELDAPLPEGE